MTRAHSATVSAAPLQQADLALRGVPASAVLAPASEQECSDVVRTCAERGVAIVPLGGGTCLHIGEPLRSESFAALSLDGMARCIAVSAADSLVTCAAGVRFAELQAALSAERQHVPLDPPRASDATVGGVVASDAYGLLRCAHGSARDTVVALRMVIGAGEVVSAGARVVKNAAGYDICRLATGSRGALGVITEVTFRTRPRARAQAHIGFAYPDARSAVRAALSLSSLEADCTYVAVVGRGVLKGPFTLLVGIAGTEGHMAALSQRVRALVAADGPAEDAGPTRSQAEADRARGILHGIDVGAAIRVALPPSEASRAIPKLAPDDEEWTWLAPCGVLAAGTPSGSPERDRSFVERLVAEWPASKSRLWLRLPDSHYGSVPVFGGYGPALPLIRAIKAAFDPAGSFSPGRLAGAI